MIQLGFCPLQSFRMGDDDQKVITFDFHFTVQIYVSLVSLEEEKDFLGVICTF